MTARAPNEADDLGPQIDAMLADAEQKAESAPTPGAAEDFESEIHGAVGEDEAKAVAAARQRAAGAAPDDSPDTAQPTPATIDELDEQLADAAPDEDDLPQPKQDPASVAAQTLEQMREEVSEALTAAPMEEEPEPSPESEAETSAEPEPAQVPEPEPVASADETPEPEAPDSEPEPLPEEPEPSGERRRSPFLALLRAVPLALAWPLSFLPPAARDQVGWLALVTLFNAGAVWVYLLLKH